MWEETGQKYHDLDLDTVKYQTIKVRKHNTGKCDNCGPEETKEHVIMKCRHYQAEREQLIQKVREIKVYFNLKDIPQNSSRYECYRNIFQCLRLTNMLILKIFFEGS